VAQGEIVADSLMDYLKRHSELDLKLTKNHSTRFFTTDDANDFEEHATVFFGEKVNANRIELTHIK
jgi:glutamate racemase